MAMESPYPDTHPTSLHTVNLQSLSIKDADSDAGALFVLESKGNWVHAGYHLTTSIAGPALLSLPYAFASLGWIGGLLFLLAGASVTFYAYTLLSLVLEREASSGHRFLRFRDLAYHIVGPRITRYGVAPVQFSVCLGAVIVCTVLGGQSMKSIYLIYYPDGSIRLYEFIICFGLVMMILSQLPSFHSLRYVNLVSLITCFGYSACAVGASIYAGYRRHTPKDYTIKGGKISQLFGIFNAFAVIALTYGNSIIPEIQATIAPPVSGKMFKGLCMCYMVVVSTFFSVAISGYWAFGNEAEGNLMSNFTPAGMPTLVPGWLIFLTNIFILIQLLAVALVYSQPTFEVVEGMASDSTKGIFSLRNLIPRLVLRGFCIAIATLVAAMIPFFGDLNALMGAFGVTPLDFVLPMLFYNMVFKPSRRSYIFLINSLIIVVFTIVGAIACIAAVHQIVLDAKTYKLFANL